MDPFIQLASTAGSRLRTNVGATFANMSMEKWIRLVVIVGAYMLLRPYLMKLGERMQMKSHERDEQAEEAEEVAKARISPNELRGKVDIPDDSDDDDVAEETTAAAAAADWGKKARRRQREVLRKMLDAEEKRLQDQFNDEEDKDIEEFLIKE